MPRGIPNKKRITNKKLTLQERIHNLTKESLKTWEVERKAAEELKPYVKGKPIEPVQGIYAAGTSGALSSSRRIRYDLLPRVFTTRIAVRFELGANKYPAFNYKQGLDDKEYIIERINHLIEHVLDFIAPEENNQEQWQDDNLAAIGWAVAFLMECETTVKGRDAIREIRLERSARCKLEP